MASTSITGIVPDNRGVVNTLYGALTDGTSHASPVTNSVATDYADLSGVRNVSIQVVNGITNTCTFTLQGSNDGTNWNTVSYGQGSGAAYTQAALVAVAGTGYLLELPADDVYRYIRANVSAANSVGTTFTLYGRS